MNQTGQWPNGQINPAAMYSNQYDQFSAASQNATPAPSFNGFQPPSVIPAKRSHDDQQHMSRSQTPSYNLPQQNGQQFANGPYQHLQNTNSNATPSPTLSNQPFRQPQPQSRMQNASPSPFPQQQQPNFNQAASSMAQQPGQAAAMAQQGQAGFNGMGASNMSGMPSSMPGQMNSAMNQANVQRMYQMRLQQQQQAMR
ncbi:hypothetical protein LTR17_027532, partial [Elasticomyces elasticus]